MRKYFPPLLVLVACIGIWELVVSFGNLPGWELPSPLAVLRTAFVKDRSELVTQLGITFKEIVLGFLIAVAVGFVLSIALAASRPFRMGVYPLLIGSQTIPILALAPLMILWFGFGILPKVLVIVLFGFFPVVLNTTTGMNLVDRDAVFLMRMLGAGKYKTIWRLRLPASMPYFFIGVKQAAVYSAIGAIAGEWVGAQKGLGPLMIAANFGVADGYCVCGDFLSFCGGDFVVSFREPCRTYRYSVACDAGEGRSRRRKVRLAGVVATSTSAEQLLSHNSKDSDKDSDTE